MSTPTDVPDARGVARTAESRRGGSAAVLAASVFLVALTLRPALTSVGPMLPRIGAEEHLGKGLLGLLGALPLLAFAAVSPMVHLASRRLGMERTVGVALVVMAVAIVARSYTGLAGLWVGTLVVGGAITIGNVLVPAIVKRDYAGQVSRATGIYSACIAVAASTASGVAVPLADAHGWRGSLAFWALPCLVIAVLWLPRTRAARRVAVVTEMTRAPLESVWRQPTAWLVTAFMGLQSTTFYIVVTWLPTIETTSGTGSKQAGLHLFVYQIVGIASGLAIPLLMRTNDQRAAAVTASTPMLVGTLGLLVAPRLGAVWALVAGLGSGASLVVALTLISVRGRTHHETTQLSGMAQSMGYLFAAGGPVAAGVLAQRTGSWHVPLLLLATLAVLQIVAGASAGRDRRPVTG